MFALGVAMFMMIAQRPPFLSSKSNDKDYKLIAADDYGTFWYNHTVNQ